MPVISDDVEDCFDVVRDSIKYRLKRLRLSLAIFALWVEMGENDTCTALVTSIPDRSRRSSGVPLVFYLLVSDLYNGFKELFEHGFKTAWKRYPLGRAIPVEAPAESVVFA